MQTSCRVNHGRKAYRLSRMVPIGHRGRRLHPYAAMSHTLDSFAPYELLMMSDGTPLFVLLYKNGGAQPSSSLTYSYAFLYLGIFATDCPEGDELLQRIF